MKVIDLGEGLLVFMFDPPPGEFEGLNLLALVEGGEALLLDAGYKENLREVLAHLEGLGAKPAGAVISHYHPDHADGLALVPGVETWGHAAYQETLDRCFRPGRPVSLHADALRKLRCYLDMAFVPGHGAPVLDRPTRERDLANRLSYVEALSARPGIGLDEAQASCSPRFLGSEWHEENWK